MDEIDEQEARAEKHGEYVVKNVTIIGKFSLFFGLFGLVFAFFVGACWVGDGILGIAALACFAIGAAFGFLFSIPKSAQNSDGAVARGADSGHVFGDIPRDNTNLEQISDWFVKILIGASLVQLGRVKDAFDSLAIRLSKCLLAAKHEAGGNTGLGLLSNATVLDPYCQAFCLLLIFYYLTVGFLAGYLITRLWLPYVILKSGLAMKSAQRADDESKKKADEAAFLADTLDALRTATRSLENNAPDDNAIRLAVDRSERCQKIFPTNRTLGILMGRFQRFKYGYDSAINTLNQFVSDWRRSGKPEDKDFAAFLFNLACYKNQKAVSVRLPEEAEKERESAWKDLTSSCELDADNKKEALSDKDLESLFNTTNRTRESLA